MALQGAFLPLGPAVFVGSTPRQANPISGSAIAHRVRNLSGTAQYLAWGTTSAVSAPVAPTDGNPSSNTLGMLPGSVETFSFPPNSWFIAGSATGFELTPGEGL